MPAWSLFLTRWTGEMNDADLVICRAGATPLAESRRRAPVDLIPLPTATDDHQRKYAEAMARAGARGDRPARVERGRAGRPRDGNGGRFGRT